MTRRFNPISILAAALLMPLGALAAETAAPPTDPPAKEAPKAHVTKKPVEDCRETAATRIHKNKPGECAKSTQPTRTYTKEDLDSTGQTDTGEALKRLDPRFQ